MIRCDDSTDHCLAETRVGIDDQLLTCPADWVGGEHHTCDISGHHFLNNDRKFDSALIYVLLRSIKDGALRPKRHPTSVHCLDQGRLTFNVQEGFLLTGKGSSGQIFSGRARTDSNCTVA